MNTPFVVKLISPYRYYHMDVHEFLPPGHDATKAIKSPKR